MLSISHLLADSDYSAGRTFGSLLRLPLNRILENSLFKSITSAIITANQPAFGTAASRMCAAV